MRKRLFSVFLALALVLALMPVPVRAAGNAAILCDDVTASPGEWLCVPIRCQGFENLAALELELYYDPSVLQFQQESTGWLLEGAVYHVGSNTAGKISLSAAAAHGISGEGELMYLYFSVAADCPAGKYPLTLAVGEAYDASLTPVKITARSGSVQVAESAPVYGEFHLGMELSADTLSPGDTVTACVRNDWGHGFAGLDLKVFYDPAVFELVNAEVSEELGTALCSLHTGTDGLVRLSCASSWQIWCYDLVTLELRVRDGATGTTQLIAEVSDIYDENRIPYQPGTAQTQVTIKPARQTVTPELRLESETFVIGEETTATLILGAGSNLAAADFRLEYDPAVLECLAVESAAEGAYLIINPNYTNGTIRFSYVLERGTTEEIPLVTIRWRPRANASSHFSLETTLIDPVDRDHARVEIDCPVRSGCIYRQETSDATCTQPGGTAMVCVGCGDRIPIDVVPALGHTYGDPTFRWSEDHERCSASRICDRDASHIWQVDCTVTHVSEGESCTAPGSITYTATADFYGEIYTDQVTIHLDSLGHDYAWTVLTEPGCTTEGLRHGDCIRCDAIRDEAIAPLGHDYMAVVTDPTCTEGGYTTHTCTRCADSYTDSRTEPTGHHHEWFVLNQPTCTGEGLEQGTCSNCGDIQTRIIPALGHDWNGGSCSRCGEPRENPFVDVPEGSFYYTPVIWAVQNGITNGTSATTFGPNDSCMRAHVVTFLWRAAGSPEPVTSYNPFVDVKETDFYYKAVLWAVECGITNGLDASHFGPFSYCNRAQVVTFLHRALRSPIPSAQHNPFTDVPAGSFYHIPVLWAVEKGVTNGLSANEFGPNAICNRAQIVAFLYRAFA